MAVLKKPEWLKVQYDKESAAEVAQLMKDLKLNTVCQEANCPNIGECYQRHTATFMILGNQCTRNCRFCNVATGRPGAPDPEEPMRVAEVAKKLGLAHVVVTQVTRDDLSDGGALQMAETVRAIKSLCPKSTVEVLISDLKGSEEALRTVLEAHPDVMNHNVEMVKELYRDVRPQAKYERSLKILSDSKRIAPDILTKTGFMLGLGETEEQVDALIDDIYETGCDILTISQYLSPSSGHWELKRYVPPEEFAQLKEKALQKGFRYVASGPLVRSSYRAYEALTASRDKES